MQKIPCDNTLMMKCNLDLHYHRDCVVWLRGLWDNLNSVTLRLFRCRKVGWHELDQFVVKSHSGHSYSLSSFVWCSSVILHPSGIWSNFKAPRTYDDSRVSTAETCILNPKKSLTYWILLVFDQILRHPGLMTIAESLLQTLAFLILKKSHTLCFMYL